MFDNLKQMLGNAKEMNTMLGGIQSKLKVEKFEGVAGGGMVKIVVNGIQEVVEVHIDSSSLAKDNKFLEDLIKSAFNQALQKASVASQKMMMGLMQKK
ncbi:MAG: YbaB/EbfC family nucleoid-associated protein [bacterium]|nr:YbaB/EbfC family nucleoid-associated protein [bacterium]